MSTDPPWFQPPATRTGRCTVIGAGIAGCSIAYALDQLDIRVCLVEQHTTASGASANQRAVLRPHLVRQESTLNHFNETAFTYCVEQLATLNKTHAIEYKLGGVLRLVDNPAHWPSFDSTYAVNEEEASRLANINLPSGALFSSSGGWVNLQSYCHALLDACRHVDIISNREVTQLNLQADTKTWQLDVRDTATGMTQSMNTDNVVIANGPALHQFFQTRGLPLTISVGQTTRCTTNTAIPDKVITGKRYLIPDATHCTVGATHHRLEDQQARLRCDTTLDNTANLDALAGLVPSLTGKLKATDHWMGSRGSTPDRLPMVGAVPDLEWYAEHYALLKHGPTHQHWAPARYHEGLYLLSGLGSRGVATTALAARILANLISGRKESDEQQFRQLLHPARFIIRTLQRARQ